MSCWADRRSDILRPFAPMPAQQPNFNLFFARLYYFAFMGGWGFILPFMNLFYVSLGFSGKEIGLIASVSAIVGMFASPIWVSEVKKRPQARRLMQIAILLGGLVYYWIGTQRDFFPVVLLIFLHALVAAGIMALSDSMAVTVTEEAGAGYGSVRVFASLGWIASTLSSGWLIEHFGYIAAFIGIASIWFFAAAVVFFIPPRYFTYHEVSSQPKANLRVALQRVFQNRTLLGFAFALVMVGFLNNGVLQFESVFLQELGASKQLISVAGILSAIVELPCMLYADRIVRRVGAHQLMLIALALTFFQRMIIFVSPSIPTIMIIRFMGGVAFSFYTISFVNLISTQTDPRETGTVLALYTVTIASLVNIIAAPVGGAIFDAIGARWLYALSASGYLIAFLSLWFTRPAPKPD